MNPAQIISRNLTHKMVILTGIFVYLFDKQAVKLNFYDRLNAFSLHFTKFYDRLNAFSLHFRKYYDRLNAFSLFICKFYDRLNAFSLSQ